MRIAAIAILGAALWAGACSSTPEAPHGSPVLLEVHWVAAGGRARIWARDADAAVASHVPGAATEIDFVFDRRLDGSRIEDVVGNTTVPKAIPPISVTWPGKEGDADGGARVMSDPEFSHKVLYNSTAVFGGMSSYAFLRPMKAGFPSATTVTFTLDTTAFTSAYGEVMDGPSEISVETEAMTIVARPDTTDAAEAFPPTFKFPVRFTNRPASFATLTQFARARTGGVDLPVAVFADAGDDLLVYVAPAACLGGWPLGAVIDVSFVAGTPDAFGVPIAADLPAGSFRVGGMPPESPADGGCD